MLSSILRMLAMAKVGASAKRAAAHGLRTAALCAFAALLVILGAGFALAAGYLALLERFAPVEAAGIMALALALPGLAIFTYRSISSRRTRSSSGGDSARPETAVHAINQSAQDMTRALGPTNMIALALMAGIAAGRSLTKS